MKTVVSTLVLLGGTLWSAAQAAEPTLPRDGWVSWQVEAVEDAPDWCCFTGWSKKGGERTACKLDSGRDGYNINDRDATTDSMRVYVRLSGGKVDRRRPCRAPARWRRRRPSRNSAMSAPTTARDG
jgi:hypothetical protein